MQFKTLADVKRHLEVGATVTMVRHDWYPNNKLMNLPRKVVKKQTNGVQFEGGSWLMFPPASDVVGGEDEFTVALSIEKAQFMTYKIGSYNYGD